jgi:hypothetical protein
MAVKADAIDKPSALACAPAAFDFALPLSGIFDSRQGFDFGNGYEGFFDRQAVHWRMEKAFDLRRMQINSDHMVDTDNLQNISDQPRHDRLAPAVAFVGSPMAEVRYDRRNARSSGTTASVRESEKLEQVVAYGRRGRLHEKELFAAYAVEDLHRYIAVRITIHHTAPELSIKLASNPPGQRWVGRAGEDREIINHAPTSTPQVAEWSSAHRSKVEMIRHGEKGALITINICLAAGLVGSRCNVDGCQCPIRG